MEIVSNFPSRIAEFAGVRDAIRAANSRLIADWWRVASASPTSPNIPGANDR